MVGEGRLRSNLETRDVSSDSGFPGPVPLLEGREEVLKAPVSPAALAGEERGKGVESPRGEDRFENLPGDVSSDLRREGPGPREPGRFRMAARVSAKREGSGPGPARRQYTAAGLDGPPGLIGTPYSLLQK